MRKTIIALIISLLASSCGPARYALVLEMRQPSKAGVDLGGRNVSVIYADAGEEQTRQVSAGIAESFAKSLEEYYATGEGSVGVFFVNKAAAGYSSRDSLRNLLIDTGSDLVFLLDVKKSGNTTSAGMPLDVSLYCYDGMDWSDEVKMFTGKTLVQASSDKELVADAARSGKTISESFAPQWKQEQFSIAYFDGRKWYDAIYKAEQYDWKGAMDIWFSLLDTNDMLKRACAAYNIAVACYLMGDFELAGQWLDRSDADNRISSFSGALRKRLELVKK